MPIETDRILLPATVLSEERLLGAIMVGTVVFGDAQLIKDVKAIVSPSDFCDYAYKGDRARIYAAIINCEHPDIVTVTYELIITNKLKPNDTDYLRDLLMGITGDTTSYNYMDYARIVKDLSLKRASITKPGGVSVKIK